jgi:methionine-rich copper-binding protein CopC
MRFLLRAAPVVLVLLFQASPAGAHANYESSNPADGSSVSSPPSQVEATFSEPVSNDSYMEITDPCGNVVSGDSQPFTDRITTSMSGTHAGTYSVFYRVQSTVDNHVTQGQFTFTSSGGDPCPGSEPPPDQRGGDGNGNGDGGGNGGGGDDPVVDGGDGSGEVGGSSGSVGSGGGGSNSNGTERNSNGDGQQNGSKNGGPGGSRTSNGGNGGFETAGGEAPDIKPAPWDLPAGGVIFALFAAALIGAAGGRIYASLLGPRT